MALLQRTRILPNERLDLPDYNYIENFVCADFCAIHKRLWSDENFVISGFVASGLGTNTLSVELADSTVLVGADEGVLFIGAPSLTPLTTSTLTPNARNYVEIFIDQDSGGADSRAFWDQTAGGGAGGEFSQIVDTFLFTKASFAINTSNFTGDANKTPIVWVDVDSSGIITAIEDRRPRFFRLGRPNNAGFSFNWINGRGAENPSAPTYDDPDKHISSLKQMFDAIMDSIREIKGTTYWYEAPFTSLTNVFQSTSLTVLSGATSSSSFKWTGTELQITDGDSTPSATDPIAHIRFFNLTANVSLLRHNIPLSDGDVLWVELPDPVVNTNYDGIGSSASNYRVSPRGSVTLNDSVYWLAYVEGTRIFLRGLGELEAGEERQINDESTAALQKFLGFNPETATSVPYPFVPNPLIWSETFTSNDHLVRAIGVNAQNINLIGEMLDESAYEETYEIVSGLPANPFELQGPIAPSTIISLPPDSRDALSAQDYVVGDGVLHVYHDGQFLVRGKDFNEVGLTGSLSTQIQILRELQVGERLTFRMASLGGFSVGPSVHEQVIVLPAAATIEARIPFALSLPAGWSLDVASNGTEPQFGTDIDTLIVEWAPALGARLALEFSVFQITVTGPTSNRGQARLGTFLSSDIKTNTTGTKAAIYLSGKGVLSTNDIKIYLKIV